MVTHIANGRIHQPTNCVNDSAPNLPNNLEIGPPTAAIILKDKIANPPIKRIIMNDKNDLKIPEKPLSIAAPIA